MFLNIVLVFSLTSMKSTWTKNDAFRCHQPQGRAVLLHGCLYSRKHGEGFFRWVHLSCSHESHYKVSLQGIIIMKVNARSHCKESLQGVIARSHCKEPLQGVIARSHCKEPLQGVIARSHCKESLQGVIARSHCKESLQGVMRLVASCKEPSAWSQVQVASASSQVQVASARSQVQVASARSQVQLTCEELKSLLRAAG